MLIIIQESIKNRTNLVYQKNNEVHWVVLRIQHICNTPNHKSLIYGLFLFSKRYQRDNKNQISENNKTLENVYFQGSFVIEAKKTGEVFMADRYSKDKDYKVVTVIILTAYRGKEDRPYL